MPARRRHFSWLREKERESKMQIEKHEASESPQVPRLKNSESFNSESVKDEREEDEASRSALIAFRAKEEQIERKKLEVRERVQAQLGRIEEETKRLSAIKEELETLSDPTRKEVASVRKKIDSVSRDLKPLGQACAKKEKEYKEALEAYNEKNREKSQLITKLMELVAESEKLRMKRLEELNKNLESLLTIT